jgi:chitinase
MYSLSSYSGATRMRRGLGLILAIIGLCQLSSVAGAGLWSTGYFPGWEQASMTASNIDFTALTHVIHFAVVPNSNGTLDSGVNNISFANSTNVISCAHADGKPALICVGGPNTETAFQAATSAANLPVFINNLTNFMATRGYDGIDIDWEPLSVADGPQFANLVQGLRTALNPFTDYRYLTVAALAYPMYGDSSAAYYGAFAVLATNFDQINIITYDLSGPYPGWVTWHNSPIYDGGYRFSSTGGLVPSVDGAVSSFITNGVLPAKLGIGIPFYGYVWQGGNGTPTGGVTAPRQSWTNAPTMSYASYNTIIASYYQTNHYYWDTNAQASYLSFDVANPTNDMFISYNDPRACQSEVSYARNHGLGGVMIWELAQDHVNGQTDPLLQAVKQALASPGVVNIQLTGQDIQLSFSGIALGSYRIQWNDNVANNSWNTLAVTNISGPGGLLQIIDPNPFNQPQRFYRVQTPP